MSNGVIVNRSHPTPAAGNYDQVMSVQSVMSKDIEDTRIQIMRHNIERYAHWDSLRKKYIGRTVEVCGSGKNKNLLYIVCDVVYASEIKLKVTRNAGLLNSDKKNDEEFLLNQVCSHDIKISDIVRFVDA